jgi:hypothetical protein
MTDVKRKSLYSVTMKDGTVHENLTYAETLVFMLPGQYDYVRPMGYAQDMDPANETRRKQWTK